MKTFLTIAFVAFLAVTTSAVATTVHPSYTQNATTSCFSYLRAHRQMSGVGLMWGVSQQGVARFIIERSYDGEFFEDVDVVTAHGGAQYRFTDRGAYPGYLTYRITAIMDDGATHEAKFKTVHIVSRK